MPEAGGIPVDLDRAVARFTANLREARRRSGLTQEAVALTAGMDQGHYSNVETGKHDPGFRTLVRIAAALNTTPADLVAAVTDAD